MLTKARRQIGVLVFREMEEEQALEQAESLGGLVWNDEWDLTGRRLLKLRDKGVLSELQMLKIGSLKIRWSNAREIMVQIKTVSFPWLKELYLNGNNIASIDVLSTICLPALQNLNLKQNNIKSIRSLRKCVFPALQNLTLYKNKISDFSPLTQLCSPTLTILWISPQSDTFDSNSDHSWVTKLQTNSIKFLYLRHERALPFNFEVIRPMIKQRYPKGRLFYRAQDDIGVRLE